MSEPIRTRVNEDGYIVARNVLSDREIEMMQAEMDAMITSSPIDSATPTDWNGRADDHPEDFSFDCGDDGSPILKRISNQLARSRVMRTVYGNPNLLALVEEVYGRSFVPFAESIVIKLPENGSAFAYHQDGKRYDIQDRGLNLGIYLHPSTQDNGCLRVVPGSHLNGLIDVHSLAENHGPILPDNVPVEAETGDITIHDRSVIHGSLPNSSPDLRITIYFGFHKLESVESIHDEEHIRKRAQVVSLCIRERQASGEFVDEKPYEYALSGFAPSPDTDDEIETVLRAPALGI